MCSVVLRDCMILVHCGHRKREIITALASNKTKGVKAISQACR